MVPRKTESSLSAPAILSDNWKNELLGCGSNAFNQLYVWDSMLSSFSVTEVIKNAHIEYVTCGSTTTAVIASPDGIPYIWGTGGVTSLQCV